MEDSNDLVLSEPVEAGLVVVNKSRNFVFSGKFSDRVEEKLSKLETNPDDFYSLNEELTYIRIMLEKELRSSYAVRKIPKNYDGSVDEKELNRQDKRREVAKERVLTITKLIKDIVKTISDIQEKKNKAIPLDQFYRVIQQIGLVSRKYVPADKMEQFSNDVCDITSKIIGVR